MKNRRSFIQQMAAGVPAATLIPFSGAASTVNVSLTGALVHHVFFWLKEPRDPEVRKRFETALRQLLKVKTIRLSHTGIPASTEQRDVVDHTYTYSYMVIFDSKEDHESYQVDPVHQKFVKENSQLWSKVVVYDSVDMV